MTEGEAAPEGVDLRPARHEDADAVVAFTTDTWEQAPDYIPDVFHDWVDQQSDERRTLVADAGDDIAGLLQGVMLSDREAWAQGMRVNPAFRGAGVGRALTEALFDWARAQGAAVMRNMVFSWNQAGLGQSRAVGFEPVTEFRWLTPDPAAGTVPEAPAVDRIWSFWRDSRACEHLAGLTLSLDESWAVQELTPALLDRAAAETALLGVADAAGVSALAYRTRTVERDDEDGEPETLAEYGVGAWADLAAAGDLVEAIAADAASVGADATRVVIPETPQFVSDGAALRAGIDTDPDFVLAASL